MKTVSIRSGEVHAHHSLFRFITPNPVCPVTTSSMPRDYDSDSDSDSDGYDIDDPRTREHEAYKIAQENGARSRRRYKYGDDVDADGENYSPDEEDNHDSMEVRLQNAREARGWALEYDLTYSNGDTRSDPASYTV